MAYCTSRERRNKRGIGGGVLYSPAANGTHPSAAHHANRVIRVNLYKQTPLPLHLCLGVGLGNDHGVHVESLPPLLLNLLDNWAEVGVVLCKRVLVAIAEGDHG